VSAGWHVAQVNIALPREPLDSPALAEFVANLEPVNALADGAPGFVWRLADETGDATSITFKRRFPPPASGTEPRPAPRPAGAAAIQARAVQS
jgi:Domain of unknown function (DUF3291)